MAKIVLVGEAWGSRESLFEHAFVGASGQELARMLCEAKLAPDVGIKYPSEWEMIAYWKRLRTDHGIELANVFNARPLDNRVEEFFTSAKEGETSLPAYARGKYLRPELMFHLEALWTQIKASEPNLVVAFGNTACWATLGETKISALRGTMKLSEKLGCKVLPTYHPAAILRQWNLRSIVVADLEKAAKEAESKTIRRIERWLTVEPTLAEITEWFTRPAEFYAVDIENPKYTAPNGKSTYLNGQLAMIGFARSPADAIVIPFFDDRKTDGNFWPCIKDEIAAWKLADKALRLPVPKIFQNGIYDLTHLLRSGFRPANCAGDTMLMHHALYPEMLKSLGFLGSIYSTEVAWKQMTGKGNNLKRDE